MKRIIATASVRGQDDMSYVTHVKSDVKAHHDFIKFRKALRALAKKLDGGICIAYDNTVSLGFWQDLTHIDLIFEIEDVKIPA